MGRLYQVVCISGAARILGNALLAVGLLNAAVASPALAQDATNPGSCSGTNCLVIVPEIYNGVVTSNSQNGINNGTGDATGVGSIVIGGNSFSSGNSSIVLGENSTDGGASDVLSIGNASTGLTRRITNVAPGIASSDAATVGQLQSTTSGILSQANSYTDSAVSGSCPRPTATPTMQLQRR